MKPSRIPPGPGQESVWDYPRPPRLEDCSKRIRILFNGAVIADTMRAKRVLETSHPPVYYLPPEDLARTHLAPADGSSFCEWKGSARYFDVVVGDRRASRAAWSYPNPTLTFAAIKDYVAFYCAPMDACLVDGEKARPQPGGFYGGWITDNVVGPFKGEPGTSGW
jgi:uncharacterized protein (DUF427 family)